LTSRKGLLEFQQQVLENQQHPADAGAANGETAMNQQELSKRERQIMDVLYQMGEATVGEVLERIPEPPSYSAVRATLRVLEEKGHVQHKQDGRVTFIYLQCRRTKRRTPRSRICWARSSAVRSKLQ
jgi:predicted transcriptional regulator